MGQPSCVAATRRRGLRLRLDPPRGPCLRLLTSSLHTVPGVLSPAPTHPAEAPPVPKPVVDVAPVVPGGGVSFPLIDSAGDTGSPAPRPLPPRPVSPAAARWLPRQVGERVEVRPMGEEGLGARC